MVILGMMVLGAIIQPTLARAERIYGLEATHGPLLDQAPFVMRYKFYKLTHKDWKKSTYDERKYFLEEWYIKLKRDHKAAIVKARTEARALHALRREKLAAQRKERTMIKRFQAEQKAELKTERDRLRDFNANVRDKAKEITKMRQQQKKSR